MKSWVINILNFCTKYYFYFLALLFIGGSLWFNRVRDGLEKERVNLKNISSILDSINGLIDVEENVSLNRELSLSLPQHSRSTLVSRLNFETSQTFLEMGHNLFSDAPDSCEVVFFSGPPYKWDSNRGLKKRIFFKVNGRIGNEYLELSPPLQIQNGEFKLKGFVFDKFGIPFLEFIGNRLYLVKGAKYYDSLSLRNISVVITGYTIQITDQYGSVVFLVQKYEDGPFIFQGVFVSLDKSNLLYSGLTGFSIIGNQASIAEKEKRYDDAQITSPLVFESGSFMGEYVIRWTRKENAKPF